MGLAQLKTKLERRAIEVEGDILWAITMSAYLMAAADGEISEEEFDTLGQTLAEISESDVDVDDVAELLESMEEVRQEGFDFCVQEVRNRLPTRELREAAIVIAGAVAFVDGELTRSEEKTFRKLSHALGFSEEEATALVEEAMD